MIMQEINDKILDLAIIAYSATQHSDLQLK